MNVNWIRVNVLIAFALLFASSELHAETTVDLHDLVVPTDNSKDSKSALMELSLGLHRIEPQSNNIDRILIAIHDADSSGFEWIRPLQIMDDESTDSFFVRWNPAECPSVSKGDVIKELTSLLESNGSVTRVTLVGHGLGGVYLSQFARDWKSLVPIDVHVIAAPLQGTIGIFNEKECGEILPKRLPPTIRYFQWRIEPSLSNLFKEHSQDPQVIDLDGSLIISLPEKIAGESVDHNHALEIFATRAQAEYLDAQEQSTPIQTNP